MSIPGVFPHVLPTLLYILAPYFSTKILVPKLVSIAFSLRPEELLLVLTTLQLVWIYFFILNSVFLSGLLTSLINRMRNLHSICSRGVSPKSSRCALQSSPSVLPWKVPLWLLLETPFRVLPWEANLEVLWKAPVGVLWEVPLRVLSWEAPVKVLFKVSLEVFYEPPLQVLYKAPMGSFPEKILYVYSGRLHLGVLPQEAPLGCFSNVPFKDASQGFSRAAL